MNKILAAFLFVGAVILLALGLSTMTAHKAMADTIACGGATCTVSSQQSAGSVGGVGSPGGASGGGGNIGGGGGGGGSSAPSPYIYETSYAPCGAWYGFGGGTSTSSKYPSPEVAGNYFCYSYPSYSNNKYFGGQTLICAPQGGKAANGVRTIAVSDKDDHSLVNLYYACAYPTDGSFYPSVYTIKDVTGGQGWFYATGGSPSNAQSYGSSGILSDTTGYRASNYDPNNPGNNPTLNQTFNARTYSTGGGAPYYGYYRLQWLLNYAHYKVSVYPAWMGQPNKYEFTGTSSSTQVNPYTYACNYTPPMRAGIVGGAKFDAAQCQTSTWKCTVTGNIAINGSSNNMVVMRNGDKLSVTFPSFNISGNGAKNMRDKQTITSVNTNSVSPVNPNASDANNARQYFDASWVWNSWQSYKQTGNWLAFYWSSDNGKNFNFTQQYKFTADFLVPTQGTINGPTVNKWVTDTTSCGGTKNSPQVTVTRSIGD